MTQTTPGKPRIRVRAGRAEAAGRAPEDAPQAGARTYRAARPDRLAPFLMADHAPASVLARDLPGLIAHSREAARNNDYVRGYLGMVARQVVGPRGIALQSQVTFRDGAAPDALARGVIERGWAQWGAWGEPTLCGRLSWRDVQALAIKAVASEGNFLARIVTSRAMGRFGFRLQVLSIDHLDIGMNASALRGGGYIRNGVECDASDRAVAYHMFPAPRGDAEATHRRGARERIPAANVIHLFLPEEPLQTIGRPWLHTALRRLNMIEKFEEAALAAARYGASKMVFFKRPDDDAPTPAADGGDQSPIEEVAAGETGVLPPGWDIAPFDPNYPSAELAPFVAHMLRGATVGMRTSYASATGDLSQANFASLRAGLSEERDEWRALHAWFSAAFHGRVFNRWLDAALVNEALAPLRLESLERYRPAVWRARGWQSITPREEAETLLRNKLAAPSDLAAERGQDFEELVSRYAADMRTLAAAGLHLPTAVEADAAAPLETDAPPSAG